jgi:hypothetical protein
MCGAVQLGSWAAHTPDATNAERDALTHTPPCTQNAQREALQRLEGPRKRTRTQRYVMDTILGRTTISVLRLMAVTTDCATKSGLRMGKMNGSLDTKGKSQGRVGREEGGVRADEQR